jgi:IS1 family transposase
MEERNFVTDDYEAYHQLIPEAKLRTGKDLTYPPEQDNSNTRHYIGRFKRRPQDVLRWRIFPCLFSTISNMETSRKLCNLTSTTKLDVSN